MVADYHQVVIMCGWLMLCYADEGGFHVEVIYLTRGTVSATFPNTEKRVENTTRSGELLTNLHGSVWKCGQRLS